jgi:hypothetical protein
MLVSWLMHVTPRRRFLETDSQAQLRITDYLSEVNRQLLAATSTLWEVLWATFSSLVTVSIQEPRNIPSTSVTRFLPWQMLLALIFIAVPLSETGSPYTSLHACRSIYSTLGPLHPKLASVLLAQCPRTPMPCNMLSYSHAVVVQLLALNPSACCVSFHPS